MRYNDKYLTNRRRFLTTGAALATLPAIAVSKQRDLSILSELEEEQRELIYRLAALAEVDNEAAFETQRFCAATRIGWGCDDEPIRQDRINMLRD